MTKKKNLLILYPTKIVFRRGIQLKTVFIIVFYVVYFSQ